MGTGSTGFEFATAGRIVFGAGRLQEVGEIVTSLGPCPAERPLVVTGKDPSRAAALVALLDHQGMKTVTFAVPHEPDVETIRLGTALARQERCDRVIGFGGGAALDAAKAIAVLRMNPGDVTDYLEIVGRGRTLVEAGVPFVAIPTTAGTGTEVTRNSVIASPEHRVKVSLRSPLMLARVALVDPELTYSLPPTLTATTGLDALVQLIEPFVCRRANPLTDSLCREGITRVVRSLRKAVAAGRAAAATPAAGGPAVGGDARGGAPVRGDEATAGRATPGGAALGGGVTTVSREAVAAREDMAVASLFGGLALANAGLGAVHGLAGPLGGMISAPHGAVCAALLPGVVAANLYALRRREPRSDALARYARVAELLTGEQGAAGDDAVKWLRRLVTDLEIPGLDTYGFEPGRIPELIEKAAAASSMKGNPVELTPAELAAVVEGALEPGPRAPANRSGLGQVRRVPADRAVRSRPRGRSAGSSAASSADSEPRSVFRRPRRLVHRPPTG